MVTVYVKAQTYTHAFDSVFAHISRADATTGILYERVLPFGNLTQYNSQYGDTGIGNHHHSACGGIPDINGPTKHHRAPQPHRRYVACGGHGRQRENRTH